jgi:Zn-dependent protease
MRDPLSWSIPLPVRLFGITVRVHVLFLIVLGVVLRIIYPKEMPNQDAPPAGTYLDAWALVGILFATVLLHELGHCLGARLVHGDAHEILLWPLGGLATLELPQRARAHFVAVAAGPATNLLIFLTAGLLLGFVADVRPPWDPQWNPCRIDATGAIKLTDWEGNAVHVANAGVVLLARIFWLNWILFLLNLLPGFPLDGGRLLQCLLWPGTGFRQATVYAIFAGFITMLVIGVYAIWVYDPLFLFLALFIYYTCRQQWFILENGGEDSVFGYDFSQGYTSLEGETPPPPRRPQTSFWRRWLQKRAARKIQRAQEIREAEDRRMDELLDKVHREGKNALTDEERRFLNRVSDRYRNRQ